MISLPHDPAAENVADEPTADDTSAVRLAMTRALLTRSVRNYRDALEFARQVDEALPVQFQPPFDPIAEPEAERVAWHYLLCEADAEFFAAEDSLADRISHLYDLVAPEGRRIGRTPVGETFIERAVQLDGTLYILTDHPSIYEPGRNIIAIVRADRVADLD
jgi:hypothetical protein